MPSETKILGLIPARGGSKGVPRKNIRLLGGRPLIEYTVRAAQKSKFIDRLICSTDDNEIAELVRECGCDVPFIRPSELASDSAKAIDVIQHAIHFMEGLDQCLYDPIVYLEPPAPFRTTKDIDACIELYFREPVDSAVAVYEADHAHPAYMKKIENARLRPFCMDEPEGTRRQDFEPKAYIRNGAVYVFKREIIMSGKLYGDQIVPYVMPQERSLCIDSILDWYMAEAMYQFQETKRDIPLL